MYNRNKITFKRIQAVETPTGVKDQLVTLFDAFAEITAYSAKQMQSLNIDLKNSLYTIKIRFSKDRIIKLGDKVETLEGELTVTNWTTDKMGKEKTITITASKNGI